MALQFNVYERPVTRKEYDYLVLHCQTYLIGENEKMFGPVGKAEGHEWADEDQLDAPKPEVEVEEVDGGTPEDGPVHEGWDSDDEKFVDSLDYQGKQAWLKENGLRADGDKATLRQRMLEALRDAEDDEDDEDEDEDD